MSPKPTRYVGPLRRLRSRFSFTLPKGKMTNRQFKPGFRISIYDAMILCAGTVGGILIGTNIWWAGFSVAFVLLHFFLFCNVFRISRSPELIWAGAFILLAGSTILTGLPGWIVAILCSLALSSYFIWRETKKHSYHGIFWEQWNPDLRSWWNEHCNLNNG